MPRPNPIFVIGLGVTIITLLNSIRLKHFNMKILQVTFFAFNFARFETRNATQKFANFVVEN